MPEKKATKKIATKKIVIKPVVKGLKKVSSDVCFYLCDGNKCADLLELSEVIDKVSDDVFYHHVRDVENDFANWIEHVFKEKELAQKLRETKSKDRHVVEIQKVVINHLK